jgi:two-component system chemotaxis response regulator CheB
MFSSRTIDGAAATIEALARGAADFFAKPQSLGGLEASRQIIRNELIPALRALHGQRQRLQSRISSAGKPTNSVTATSPNSRAPLATSRKISDTWTPSGSGLGTASRSESVQRVDLVVIAASTGGPNALVEIFGGLPAQFPVPLLIVQHMPPMFTQMLAERLTKTSKIPTTEAKSGAQLEPGRAWIAPGDYHMVVGREAGRWQLNVNQEPPENACRPAADPLLRSISRSHGKHTLAVILTGMGQDGLRGCESLRSVGGQIIVQDEGSSVVWGMPGYVAKAGLADRVIPLPLIATEIVRRVRHERG